MATDTDLEQTSTTSETDHGSTSGDQDSGRSEGLRADLERAWKEHTGSPPAKDGEGSDDDRRTAEPRGRAARETKRAASEDAAQRKNDLERSFAKAASEREGGATKPASEQTDAAPAAWSKEAKSAWQNLPPEVRAAVQKRESDTRAGVEQLKKGYEDLDRVIDPMMPMARQYGLSKAGAVERLAFWQRHIASDPIRGLRDLAAAYGIKDVHFGPQPQQQQAWPQQQQTQQQLSEQQARDYMASVEQRLGTFQQHMDSQQQAQVEDVLAKWSADKKHYQQVRHAMGTLIRTGVCPLVNGQVDLDGAYQMAVRMNPALHDELVTERIAAERSRASDAAKRARYSSASLPPQGPGSASGREPPRKKGLSVRESLMNAIDDARR
jgi:hypothetical protein